MVIARSFDGSGNNLKIPEFNAIAGTAMGRFTDAVFADGISVPRDGPAPRDISNIVIGQGDANVETPKLSGFLYALGQFFDHDLDLNPADKVNHIDIVIPQNDKFFPPGSVIPVTRGTVAAGTGAGTDNPAAATNVVSGFMDASQVYGSSKAVADSLRVHNADGSLDAHLATSEGNNLPIVNGMFQAGDVRVSENSALTAIQTLFMREHNRTVDQVELDHPHWTQEHVYQQARAIVAGELQNIAYTEYLPALLGKGAIDKDHGYDPHVDPRIAEEFAGAAFRFGHTTVSGDITKIANDGTVLSSVDLKDDFGVNPAAFAANGGADAILRNLAAEHAQAVDARVIDDLRNFLVDGGPRSDLAAINIDRGRDFGIGTLNDVRHDLGLKQYHTFEQITSDKATVAALKEAYHGDVNAVDLWVGGISEQAKPGHGVLGSTFSTILERQFENLRDGDRLWFTRDGLDKHTVQEIKHTTLADVILNNTDTDHIQKHVMIATERGPGTASDAAVVAESLSAPVDSHSPGTGADASASPFSSDHSPPSGSPPVVLASSSPELAHSSPDTSISPSALNHSLPEPSSTASVPSASVVENPMQIPAQPATVENTAVAALLKMVVSDGKLLQNGPTSSDHLDQSPTTTDHQLQGSVDPNNNAIHLTPDLMQALSASPQPSTASIGAPPAQNALMLVDPHNDTFHFTPDVMQALAQNFPPPTAPSQPEAIHLAELPTGASVPAPAPVETPLMPLDALHGLHHQPDHVGLG